MDSISSVQNKFFTWEGKKLVKIVGAVTQTSLHICSSPSQTTATTQPLTGIRSTSCATSLERSRSGYLAESLPHTGYEPNTCTDVSSEHTPINRISMRNSFNIENNDLTTTVAASENCDSFHQQAASSGSLQFVPACELNSGLSPDPGNSCAVMWQMPVLKQRFEKGKGDRNIDGVQTLSEGQNLHVHIE